MMPIHHIFHASLPLTRSVVLLEMVLFLGKLVMSLRLVLFADVHFTRSRHVLIILTPVYKLSTQYN